MRSRAGGRHAHFTQTLERLKRPAHGGLEGFCSAYTHMGLSVRRPELLHARSLRLTAGSRDQINNDNSVTYTEWVEGITSAALVGDFSPSLAGLPSSLLRPRCLADRLSHASPRRLQLPREPAGGLGEPDRLGHLLELPCAGARRRPAADSSRLGSQGALAAGRLLRPWGCPER